MAITPIQVPTKQPKKDAMDRILQGLQIANEVFKIPVAYETLRKEGAEADLKRDQQQGIGRESDYAKEIVIPAAEGSALGAPPTVLKPPSDYYGPTPAVRTFRRNGDVVSELRVDPEQKANFFKGEKSLREEYTGNAVTKNTTEMFQAAERIRNVFEKNRGKPLGAADLSVIYNFGKLNDPGSAVREGELELAKKSQGLLGQFTNIIDQIKNGTLLGDEGRRAMAKVTGDIMSTQMELQSRIDERYKGRSKEQGYKEGNILDNPWSKNGETVALRPPVSTGNGGGGEKKSPDLLGIPKASILEELRARKAPKVVGK